MAAVALLSLDVRSSALALVSGGLGLACVALLSLALALGRSGWIGAALGLMALVFFGHLLVAGTSSPEGAAIVGVLLLLSGELGQWSLDGRHAGRYETRVHVSRAAGVVWLGFLGLGVVALCLLAAGLPMSGGLETVAIAMTASVGLLGLVSLVAGRAPIRSTHRDAP
jgi:hypothetical protein